MLKRTCTPFYTDEAAQLNKQGERAMRSGHRDMAAVLFAQAKQSVANAMRRHVLRGGRKLIRTAGR